MNDISEKNMEWREEFRRKWVISYGKYKGLLARMDASQLESFIQLQREEAKREKWEEIFKAIKGCPYTNNLINEILDSLK